MYKKSIVEALNRYEKHSLAGRRKIKPILFYKMAQKKYSSSRQSSEIGKAENLYFFSNLTNPINKTFVTLINLINSTFLSLKIIVDTLIDAGIAKHQTSKFTHNLVFRCECSGPFQGTATSKVQLTTAHGQLYRS